MNILTDEEIIFIENTTASRSYNDHARAIEAAIMSKLAEHAGEPVAYADSYGNVITKDTKAFSRNTLTNSFDRPLYTEAQLIAAQQRTAEACANVCDKSAHNWRGANSRQVEMAEAIRNGDWREYL